ncbi:MAG TPA: arginine N-succinyltransferase [Opitutaceae bacterium]
MTIHVLRSVRESDLPFLQKLAATVEGGLTTLPNDPQFLENKIVESIRAFDPRVRKPAGEHYLFALEDVATGEVIGTSGIIACVGGFDPFYSYEIRRESFTHEPLGISKEVRVLHLKRSHKGPSEVCSLFLDPRHRASGLGRLLSLARFLFMATFPKRFDAHVIAELRGWLDEQGRSPFWESVGRHFFEWDYTTADFLSGLGNKAFIEDLMPEYPIYLSLLPPEVQAVIGRVHRDTEPALRLLLSEGFQQTDEVDIFDAGPLVRAPLAGVRTVRQSRVAVVKAIEAAADGGNGARMLVSNRAIDFRACLGCVQEIDDGTVAISTSLADALRIAKGDAVCVVPARPQTITP